MQLKNKQIIALFNAMSKLDPTLDKDNPNKGKSTFTFKAKASYALARNYKKIRGIVEDIEKTRVETFMKYSNGETDKLTGEAAVKFAKEFNELLEQTSPVELHTIDVNDLELDKNPVAITDLLSELADVMVVGEVK